MKRPDPPSPTERLKQKVAAFGAEAPLELDEFAAFWGVSVSSATKIATQVPHAEPLPRVKRWRYGTVTEYFRRLEQEHAA